MSPPETESTAPVEADESTPPVGTDPPPAPPSAEELARALDRLRRGQRLLYLGIFVARTVGSETASAVLIAKAVRMLLVAAVDALAPSAAPSDDVPALLEQVAKLDRDRRWSVLPIEQHHDLIQQLADGFAELDFEPSPADRRRFRQVVRRLPAAYQAALGRVKAEQRRLPAVRKRRRRRLLVGLLLVGVGASTFGVEAFRRQRNCITGQYFSGINHDRLVFERRDCAIDFDWDIGSPGGGMDADNFSVRWEGMLEIDSAGLYTFQLTSDDGSRLFINDKLIIDHWSEHGFSPKTSTIRLPEGETPFRVEFYERGGVAAIQLAWRPPGGELRVVPRSMLRPR